jgi:Rod binding domain-containing protein
MRTDIQYPTASEVGRNAPVSRLQSLASARETKKIAEEFASLLLLELLKSMRATLSSEGLDGNNSAARDHYLSLADIEVTRSLVKRDDMGLSRFLERALRPALTQSTEEQTS